ncbi:TlpA family protein disulfide reductase [Leifsonia sp. NPDC014704]|uniref:TlpA family protein disulfide reductase n=1 Tax=Leifsonia sp. NPDC014704 TaxID=3364123 RepID=UPI0036F459A4
MAGLALGVMVSLLAGCAVGSGTDEAAKSGAGYISGNGTITEWPPTARGKPATFVAEKTTTGEAIRADTYRGQVLVLNFWYAGCPPCRAEARDLEAVRQTYFGKGVSFLGVNLYDTAATINSFNTKYGVTYPSLMDTDGGVMLDFAGNFSPRSVPTTLVLDPQGRVAARILGRIESQTTLEALIEAAQAGPTISELEQQVTGRSR